jgi:DNA polymerase elongation subunit (family B)
LIEGIIIDKEVVHPGMPKVIKNAKIALLDAGKIELSGPISDLSYQKLSEYCLRDSQITYDLTTFNENLVMKLITTLSRISYMSLEDVTRQAWHTLTQFQQDEANRMADAVLTDWDSRYA